MPMLQHTHAQTQPLTEQVRSKFFRNAYSYSNMFAIVYANKFFHALLLPLGTTLILILVCKPFSFFHNMFLLLDFILPADNMTNKHFSRILTPYVQKLNILICKIFKNLKDK